MYNNEGVNEIEQLKDNIEVTSRLAGEIPKEFSLEVEVGEIGKKNPETNEQMLTTPQEAFTMLSELNKKGIFPKMLAIHNGSTHGLVTDPKTGKLIPQMTINVERTAQVAERIRHLMVGIVQHGTSGTPLTELNKLTKAGVIKANLATSFAKVVFENIPQGLKSAIIEAAVKENKDAKPREELINKQFFTVFHLFKEELNNLPEERIRKITQETEKIVSDHIKAFNMQNTALFFKK